MDSPPTVNDKAATASGAHAQLSLVLGGVRSGKSAFAESLAERTAQPIYVATAEVFDDSLRARVELHRMRRGLQWTTIEQPIRIGDTIRASTEPGRTMLIDSLGMWLNNVLHAGKELDGQTADLLESIAASRGPIVVVSDEVGLGGIADSELARNFADQLGRLNQLIASRAQRVYLVVAGIPTVIKGQM